MKIQNILCLLAAVLETLLFAGLAYGWPSLVSVLIAEGYFSDLCLPSALEDFMSNSSKERTPMSATTMAANEYNGSSSFATTSIPPGWTTLSLRNATECTRQQENFSLVYTIMFALTLLFSFAYGTLFDKFGTWATKAVSIASVTTGLILLIASDSSTSWVLFIAMPLLNSGGNSLLSTNIQVSNLFGEARNSVASLITGAIFSSSGVFLLVRTAYANGVELKQCFYFMLACTSFLWLKTFFLMPRTFLLFPQPEKAQKYGIIDECRKQRRESFAVTLRRPGPERKKWNSRRVRSMRGITFIETQNTANFKACVCNPLYWSGTFFFAICTLRTSFYYATFNISINQLAERDDVVGYTNAFNIVVITGVAISLLNGAINDFMTKRFEMKEANEHLARRKALLISTCSTTTIAVIMSAFASIHVLPLQYLTFITVVFLQSFSLTTAIMLLTTMFPIAHFGKLFGLQFVTAGLFAFLQYPLTILGTNLLGEDFTGINIAFILVCFLLYLHALFLYKNLKTDLPNAASEEDGSNEADVLRDQKEQNRSKYLKSFRALEQSPLSKE